MFLIFSCVVLCYWNPFCFSFVILILMIVVMMMMIIIFTLVTNVGGPLKTDYCYKDTLLKDTLFKILLITYKALNGKAPKHISDLLSLYSPGRNLRSANQKLLCKASYNLKTYGPRSFSCAAPLLWNSIPYDIRNSSTIDTFKRKLKTWLFRIAFNNELQS